VSKTPCTLRNGDAVNVSAIPALGPDAFRDWALCFCEQGGRITSFFGQPIGNGRHRLWAVLARDSEGTLELASTEVGESYRALTPHCTQAHWFEREIAEQCGIQPQGHPWLKPIRFTQSPTPLAINGGTAQQSVVPGVTNFFKLTGVEPHEVAVGPVHAGIIEPGHFRFQCHGEQVHHLEIALGYQHRGVEQALVGGPGKRTVSLLETLAGDTTIGHALAGCEAIESLAGCRVSARAQVIRAVALELERLANHTGDLGALAGDIGYLPTSSYCGRLRGDFLNLTALLCGNRFGRGLVRPGGVLFDIDDERKARLLERLSETRRDVTYAVDLLWKNSSVRSRFENAGPVSEEIARDLGLVGVAARASGLQQDVRWQFPSGIYRFAQIPVSTYHTGTVFARAYVRWIEIQRSLAFVADRLGTLPEGQLQAPIGPLAPNQVAVSLSEGWRGEICHTVLSDSEGRVAQHKVVDPSFHNWMGLTMAMRGQEISDFPLCNKSFNLSYCGHDL
jgi:Ni,Fe-hydrogenase III large subunit